MNGTKSPKLRIKLIPDPKLLPRDKRLDRYTPTSQGQVTLLDNLSRIEWLLRKSRRLEIGKTGNLLLPARSRRQKTVLLTGLPTRYCAITPSLGVFTLEHLFKRSL